MALIARLLQQSCLRKMALTSSRWTGALSGTLSQYRVLSSVPSPLMRSFLVLKNSPESLNSFSEAKADVYIMDLEDGVPKEKRSSALKLYSETLKRGIFHGHSVYVRISDVKDMAKLQEEVEALCHPDLTGFVVPMCDGPDDINKTAGILSDIEKTNELPHGHFKIITVIETLDGFLYATEIAKASPRMSGLISGNADFAACFERPPDSPIIHMSLQRRVVYAARAAGIPAIDVVGYLDNFSRLERDVTRGKALGFDGMIIVHPMLVPFVNQLHSPTRQEIHWAQQVAAGTRVYQRSAQVYRHFIGPPHRPCASHILRRHNQIQLLESSSKRNGVRPQAPEEDLGTVIPVHCKGGLTNNSIKGGEVNAGIFSLTLDSSWRTTWSSFFLNARRVNSADTAASEIGLPGIQMPFYLLSTLAEALSVSKSSEIPVGIGLGISNAVQLRPVVDGDTVQANFSLDNVEEAGRSGSIVSSTHVLVNQRNEAVFRLTKKTMYPIEESPTANKWNDQIPAESELRNHIIQNAAISENRGSMTSQPLSPNELYVHRMVKVFGPAETKGLVNLIRSTNEQYLNIKKFSIDEILVPGPFVLAAIVHNVAGDFGDILYEELVEVSHINTVNQDDMVGSVSFIHSVRQLPENTDLEEVTVRTLGIKNLDLDEMLERHVPIRLFSGSNIKSAEYEKICAEEFPLLYRRIATQVLWKFLRMRPAASDKVAA